MELLKLYTALLRRRWLVLQSVVFFTVLGAVLALILPKNYEASARVVVSSSDATMSILSDLGLSEVAQGLSSSDDQIANVIALATTRPVIDEVGWRLQLRDSDGKPYEMEEILVAGLTGELEAKPNISVAQAQGTDVLVFTARANDPLLARLMADTVVEVAIQAAQERAKSDTRNARTFIQQQLEVVRGEFDAAMGAIADAKATEEVLDLDSEVKAAITRLSELMLQYEQNAAAIQETRAKLASTQAYQDRESASAVSPTTSQQNNRIQDIRDRLTNLREQRATELTDKMERHPDIQRIDQMLAAAEADLESAIVEQHLLDPSIQLLQAQLAGQVEKGAEINESILRTTEKFGAYPDKMRRLSQLQLAANAAEEVYKSLQEQGYQIGVAEAMLVSDMRLVDPAKMPDRQSSPKLLVNTVLGFLVGCAFGLGLAFLFEYVDDSVKSPDELAEIWPLVRLGVIPRFRADKDRRIIDVFPAVHPISEAYRSVRSSLVYASLDKPLRLLSATSAVPGEGKSTFTMNLAISFARDGKRVLVVDCDLRRPVQHRAFPSLSNQIGLTDVLARRVEASAAIQPTSVDGLFVLTSGPVPTDPARLVESHRLAELLAELREQWDLVLVDTPPCLVVHDSLIIARVVDGMIVVVESGKTGRKLVSDMRARFEAVGVEPVGVALNKLNHSTSGYGYYGKAYEKYHSAAKEAAGTGKEEA